MCWLPTQPENPASCSWKQTRFQHSFAMYRIVTERWRRCWRERICRRSLDEEGALYSGKPREERARLGCEIVRQHTSVGGRSPFFALGNTFGIEVTLSHRRAPQSHPKSDLIQ